MNSHIVIEAISPAVDLGRYPAKATVGQPVCVQADIFRDGHELICAQVAWRPQGKSKIVRAPMVPLGNDRFEATFVPTVLSEHRFWIEAWSDVFGSWLIELEKKVHAGQGVASEVGEGELLLRDAAGMAKGADAKMLQAQAAALQAARDDPQAALALAGADTLRAAMLRWALRRDLVASDKYGLVVDRLRAQFSAWYEMFPRSQGEKPGQGATLRQAERRLPDIRAMGFDVLYLPPVHPIGVTKRKGKNNANVCEPSDPGCPWAIGSSHGGHTAIEPELGNLDDFAHFCDAAAAHGLEVALDFAIQCSPDHPWVAARPAWFNHRPDGSIKYAENPPKKYEDVYPINFDTDDKDALWRALCDVVLFWVARGVKIFRVDNPHTKPVAFWRWLIETVRARHPDVIFLAEAFTRPKMMQILAKVGFSQSYTYFTWRNSSHELATYLTELTTSDMRHYFRPNFFANTPDILPTILQVGGRPAFMSRLVLAATLSPSYGIYSGFELCENAALTGREEYLDAEKYEIRVRNWDAPGNIKALIAKVNSIRNSSEALQRLDNLSFFASSNDAIICFGKKSAHDILIVAVNLDPRQTQTCTVHIPDDFVGLGGVPYEVVDLLTEQVYRWGRDNYVELDPRVLPAHILRVVGG